MDYILNLHRQKQDYHDYKHPKFMVERISPLKDLRPKCPPVFDQGELGSCTANAGTAARMMLTGITDDLSRMFLYYVERTDKKNDTGAEMRDIGIALKKRGICLEKFEPYIIEDFTKAPSPAAYKDALSRRISSYATFDGDTVDDINQICAYVDLKQLPVLIGMDVYSSFQSIGADGIMKVPNTRTEKLLGGHAVLIVGYNMTKKILIVRNSWGTTWGDKGYFYMPFAVVENKLAYDTWTLCA